ATERGAHMRAAGIHYDLRAIAPILRALYSSMFAGYLYDMAEHGVPRHIEIARLDLSVFHEDDFALGLRVGREVEVFAHQFHATLPRWSVLGLLDDWRDGYVAGLETGDNTLDDV